MELDDFCLTGSPIYGGWKGQLDLRFVRQYQKTCLAYSLATAPLKVQRPFYPEGEQVCHSVIIHTAGGMVGGDRLALKIQAEAETHALVTTAAATKIYRSNGQEAQQTLDFQVGPQAWLEWLPQETIVFAAARYHQRLRVNLAPTARWLGWEITRFGRSAGGERFLDGDWHSHIEVWQSGRPLWLDRQWLPGTVERLDSPHSLSGHAVVGSLALVGCAVSAEVVQKLRQAWDNLDLPGQTGVTRLISGVLCRYRGDSTLDVQTWFRDVWQILRLCYGDRPACMPRVWILPPTSALSHRGILCN